MKKIIAATLLGGAIVGVPARGRTRTGDHGELSAARSKGNAVRGAQYGMQAVISMGTKICTWEAQGITGASDLVRQDHRSDADVVHGGNRAAGPPPNTTWAAELGRLTARR